MSKRQSQVIGLKVKSKRMPNWLANGLADVFNYILGFTRINKLYNSLPTQNPIEFSGAVLKEMNVDLKVTGEELSSIPTQGPLIVLANHPYGLIDGFIVDSLLTKIRSDVFLMGYYALGEFPEASSRIILVDPLRKRRRHALNISGWAKSFRVVSNGGVLIVFPAGAVSHFQWQKKAVRDSNWNPHIATLARKYDATVLPIYIHGYNGIFFQICGLISTKLQTLLIFNEFPKMRNRKLEVTLGKALSADTWSNIEDDKDLIQHFRQKVEALGQKEN